MWLLPALLIATAIACSIPLSAYFAWLMDGKYRAPRVLKWFEDLVDTGPQDWKQYTLALIVFNVTLFVFGFVVLCLQPIAPLNPRGLGMLEPTTIFNTVISFGSVRISYAICLTGRIPAAAARTARGVGCRGSTAR